MIHVGGYHGHIEGVVQFIGEYHEYIGGMP